MTIENRPHRLLFVGTLPDPITGQSLACEVLLKHLMPLFDIQVVDLAKSTISGGLGSWSRIKQIFQTVRSVTRASRGSDVIYLTIAESRLGNLRDIAIYLAIRGPMGRLVIHLHGGAGMRVLLSDSHRFTRFVNSYFLRRMGSVIVLGDRLGPVFQGLLPAGSVKIVPNFASNDLFVSDEQIRQKFVGSPKLKVLFLSNLIAGKGWHELLRAFESLDPKRREDFELHIAGKCEDENTRAAVVKRVGALSNATYHGVVVGETKRQLLSTSHIFCLPTYYAFEGQPISILEAYASGCVVVTTDHSGIFDVFEPGRNGFEVEPRSASSLERCLSDLPPAADLAAYAEQNLADALDKYRSQRFCDDITSVLSDVTKDVKS